MRYAMLLVAALALIAVVGCTTGGPPQPSSEVPSVTQATTDSLPPLASLLDTSLDPTFGVNGGAVAAMGDSGDPSYIPVLAELLRFPWNLDEFTRVAVLTALAKLSGQTYEELAPEQQEWTWWIEWLGGHPEVQPPPGYAAWKGRLLSLFVGREMEAFIYEGVKSRIRLDEIVWGGVPKDGIPDLTNPPVVSAEDATYLLPSDRVFGVSFNGQHRAYPLRILNAHEMANDVVGRVAFALAY